MRTMPFIVIAAAALASVECSAEAPRSGAMESYFLCRDEVRAGGGSVAPDPLAAKGALDAGSEIEASDAGGAIRCYRRAISMDRSLLPAYVALGKALLARGDGAKAARAELKRLLRLAPRTEVFASFERGL